MSVLFPPGSFQQQGFMPPHQQQRPYPDQPPGRPPRNPNLPYPNQVPTNCKYQPQIIPYKPQPVPIPIPSQVIPPNHAKFIIQAWGLFYRFPVEVIVPLNQYIDTVVREACVKGEVNYLSVMGLKIKPKQSKRDLQKAEILPPNIYVGQALQVHQKTLEPVLNVHLDLMPTLGTQLIQRPNLVYFDFASIDALTQNIDQLGASLVGLINNEGGSIIIGVDQALRIQGTNTNNLIHKQIHNVITQTLKNRVKPDNFEQKFKVKLHPLMNQQGQKINLFGLVIEVQKWTDPEAFFSFDQVFYKMNGNFNQKYAPNDLLGIFKDRKRQNKNQNIGLGEAITLITGLALNAIDKK